MARVIHSRPRKNGTGSKFCAYCLYWEGDAQLKAHTGSTVEFESTAKGFCVCKGKRFQKSAGSAPCHDFQFSIEASKYIVQVSAYTASTLKDRQGIYIDIHTMVYSAKMLKTCYF